MPFTAPIWEGLRTTLTKLVLDLGEPVRLEQNGEFLHKSFITANEMKPLQEQVELKELRLFRLHESIQPLVWETVFRNTSDSGMRLLDIQMASAPIVRSESWRKAPDVIGLTVPTEDSEEKEYKGMEGKGVLHYSIGTGEYLDNFCMRKARISAGLDEATPLPLWCLKLDGFVVDHLPFEHELSQIVLLTCGENCVDSGLRAPKTKTAPRNKWSRVVNNETSHCLIQWPNWTGIFNEKGDQRNRLGVVVPQELGLSTPADEVPPTPVVPLTKSFLDLNELEEALDKPLQRGYFAGAAKVSISNLSTRGSEVPTPTVASSVTGESPYIAAYDGAHVTPLTSFGEDTLAPADSPATPIMARAGRDFGDEGSVAASDMASNVATAGSNFAMEEADETGSVAASDVASNVATVGSNFAVEEEGDGLRRLV